MVYRTVCSRRTRFYLVVENEILAIKILGGTVRNCGDAIGGQNVDAAVSF